MPGAPALEPRRPIGQERAILRLFGVSGLDAAGRPLAGATVDRWLAGDPRALGNGIALPFAMALLEYDLEPQQLALDVASGAIDLALESELLRERDRRVVAEAEAQRLASAAIERIDAQRTVRRETIGMLGEADRPWLGVTLREPEVEAALDEATNLIAAGIDLIRVEVPIGRELADRLTDAGVDVPRWQPREAAARPDSIRSSPPRPGASGRSPACVARSTVPPRGGARMSASRPRRRRSARPRAPSSPRSSGSTCSRPMRWPRSSANAVEPDRALADHAFAHRLARRAGTTIIIGPGPLVVAPDLSSGVPSDPATRAGRALALQLLGVTLARGDGAAAGPDHRRGAAAVADR